MASNPNLGQLRAMEMFPDLSDEMDRRIAHAETRIKFWVISGVIVNLIIAVGAAVPIIYSSGTISSQITTQIASQQGQAVEIAANRKWIQERMVWEARVEAALNAQGVRIQRVSPPDYNP